MKIKSNLVGLGLGCDWNLEIEGVGLFDDGVEFMVR